MMDPLQHGNDDALIDKDKPQLHTHSMADLLSRPTVDAGDLARTAMTKRTLKQKAARLWMWIKFCIFMAVCIAGALLYWQYTQRAKTYVTDHRSCLIEAEDKSWKVTGTRHYSYTSNELFGIRWVESAAVEERTELDVGNYAIMVIGAEEGNYWWRTVTPSEAKPIKLKPALLYTFVANGKALLVNSDKFCK